MNQQTNEKNHLFRDGGKDKDRGNDYYYNLCIMDQSLIRSNNSFHYILPGLHPEDISRLSC